MARRRRRVAQISLDQLIAKAPQLVRQNIMCSEMGMEPAHGRLWRCQNGSYTARVVWRGRVQGVVLTMDATVRGLAL